MSDLLPPGNTPAPNADGDNVADFPDFWQSDMWPSIYPRMVHRYTTTAARDADLAGLGSTDRAHAYVDSLGRVTTWKGTAWIDPGAAVSYNSTSGADPETVIGNVNGTVLQTLVIPSAPFGRYLSINMMAYVSSTQTPDSWETVGTYDSLNISINVLGRFCMTLNSASSAGSGVIPGARLLLGANQGTTLRVWVRRVAGIGTGTGSAQHDYCSITALAVPV